ncbi:MAG: hypothetical protein HY800_08540, partial [Ignavibacteriales bacterium]|nr:hypothetical protein [Ignavibacteriales bacterium]
MSQVFKILFILTLVVSLVSLSIAQIQTARIIIKGISPDIKAQGRFDALSSGLPNVGKGQKVWLEALALYTTGEVRNSWIDTIITESWSLTNPPGGFASIVHTDTTTYFIPDTTGQYRVDLSVTTSHGTKDTSIYINAAKWVGVGGIVAPPDFSKGECASCHSDKTSEWQGTNHSTAFARKIDDAAGHFAGYCVSCHTVGYDVLGTAVNDGFDDISTTTGWVFPSPLQPGNWDTMKTNYPTLTAKANIQCENCHGPGSLHYSQKDKNQIVASFFADVCC